MLRKIVSLSSFSALAALLSFEGAPYVRSVVFAAQSVPITPFTAQTTEIEYDNDGIQKSIELRTTAVNSSGVQVDILDTLDGRYVGNSIILDLNKAVRISLDPATESTTTYPMYTKAVAAGRQILNSCADPPGAEHRSLWGHVTFKKIDDRQAGISSFHTESWLAPEINCFPLEATVALFRSGVRMGQKNKQVTSLTVGEPAASLFLVPPAFIERTPSQVFAELARRTGTPCPDCANAAVLDDVYRSHRQ
jgi:hypothetical protein